MGEALLKDQLAEIAVCNHQNPLLVPGDGKYILIGKPVGSGVKVGRFCVR